MNFSKLALYPFISGILSLTSSCSERAPEIEWQKNFGGSLHEDARYIIQTYDSGYVVAGYAASFDRNVVGSHGFNDYWIVKLDSKGNIQSSKTLGGSYFDEAHSILQTGDHGFIVTGTTYSLDGDVVNNHGAADWWILKLDSQCNQQWQKTIGTKWIDIGSSMIISDDGGYIFCGGIGLNKDSTEGSSQDQDAMFVKWDKDGNEVWEKIFRGSGKDGVSNLASSGDGGFVAVVSSQSNDGDFNGNHSDNFDIWLLKFDRAGNLRWKKNFGGAGYDNPSSVIQTQDGGYAIAGTTSSNDAEIKNNHGLTDFLILKLDSNGTIQWQRCFGGILDDNANSIQQTTDGGYIVFGETSSVDGDVTGNHGLVDYWVIRLNKKGKLQWQKTLGGSGNERASGNILLTSDGGFIIAGESDSKNGDVTGNYGNYDCWIVKLKGN